MISATDLKNGTTFLHYGKPYQVIKYTLIKMGRGGAIVKVNARNLESGSTGELTFSSNNTVDEANTFKRKLQYLYKDSLNAIFMDPGSFEQAEIPLKILGDDINYCKEGESVDVLFWSEKPLSVALPVKVNLKVVETDPGVKGNSASNIYKPAILENGLTVKVPLFIKVNDEVRIDTRNGEYVERVK
ncbi:MAG: elongation factor P [bacterium]|nr:elongation factor P [bacterium]